MEAAAPLGLIPLFPIIGAILAYTVGLYHRAVSGWIATLASTMSFVYVLKFFGQLPEHGYLEHLVFTWFSFGDLHVDFLFRFDHLTAVMCLVVTGVGSLIHLYSISYMAEDPGVHRFLAHLNVFMFSMLLLVMG
ncbi:MAG: NADH-quinone oxidoreductase subunit L, partial [Proteobacteria bacterium]